MEITPTIIILVGVVCVVLGFLASVLLSTLSEDTEGSVEGVNEAPPGGRKGRYIPVVRLWRERGGGTLVVEMDGKSMVAPEALTEVQRERLEKTARDLRGWLGMGMASMDNTPAQDQTPGASARDEVTNADLARVVGTPEVGQTPSAASSKPQETPSPISPAPKPVRGAVQSPPKEKEQAGKPPVADSPADKSIVMQIEDILQDMLAGTPLERRKIHLSEDPRRGVIVQVGTEYYEGIDAVADPEIKGLIQSAVHEWEKSQ
jgi:hypothetical protein